MSVSKENNDNDKMVELTGEIVSRKFAAGSKSEHDALWLETTDAAYVIRRVGGNPFNDPQLNKLKGKKVDVKGFISNYIFFAKEVKEHL